MSDADENAGGMSGGRVAVVSVGDPRSPSTWSGVTAGICSGLDELGVSVAPIDVALAPRVERALLAAGAAPTRNRFDAEGAGLVHATRSALARRALARAGAPTGVVQIGTTFSLSAGASFVTLEDMTLCQALAVHPVFSRMSERAARAWERRRARIYAAARMCAAASNWTAASLRTDYRIEGERVAVVGFGANHPASRAARDWSAPRFLFVGIDWERKGGPVLLRAFARVREVIPAATLDVIGGHPLQLSQEGVSFHGVLSQQRDHQRERLRELFSRATCFVMPSLVEPFGIAYVEAAASGIPCIGSSVGGPADVIGDDGGFVVEPSDEQALARAMLALADAETARRMGAAAQVRAAAYTWRLVAERLLRALGLDARDGHVLAEFL